MVVNGKDGLLLEEIVEPRWWLSRKALQITGCIKRGEKEEKKKKLEEGSCGARRRRRL